MCSEALTRLKLRRKTLAEHVSDTPFGVSLVFLFEYGRTGPEMSWRWLERTVGAEEEKEEEEIVLVPRFEGEPVTAFEGGRSLNWKSEGKEEKVTISAPVRERKRKRCLA